jgi:hypothetical protein
MHPFRFGKITRRNLLRSGLMSLAGLNLSHRLFGAGSRAFDPSRDEFLNPPRQCPSLGLLVFHGRKPHRRRHGSGS